MNRKFYLLVGNLMLTTALWALQPITSSDSSSTIVEKKTKNLPTITTRVHTMGLFLYMGKVVNHNPAADIFFNYTTKNGWGFNAFKVVDLNDVRSDNNFSFVFISKYFHIGKRLTVAPYLGAGLEQQHGFANHGSDVMIQALANYKINKNLSVEYIGLFSNLVIEPHERDWTNRFRLIFSQGHWDIIGMYWANNGCMDGNTYNSTGASIYYNRIPVSNHLTIGAGITALTTFQSSNQESIPKQGGIQFTTALTFK